MASGWPDRRSGLGPHLHEPSAASDTSSRLRPRRLRDGPVPVLSPSRVLLRLPDASGPALSDLSWTPAFVTSCSRVGACGPRAPAAPRPGLPTSVWLLQPRGPGAPVPSVPSPLHLVRQHLSGHPASPMPAATPVQPQPSLHACPASPWPAAPLPCRCTHPAPAESRSLPGSWTLVLALLLREHGSHLLRPLWRPV